MAPVSRAAKATIGLKVEPGACWACMARFNSGWSGLPLMAFQSRAMWPVNWRVERGPADHGEDFAAARIDRHHGAVLGLHGAALGYRPQTRRAAGQGEIIAGMAGISSSDRRTCP